MTPKTKTESSPDFVARIDDLERQSDSCYRGLELLRRDWNFATWLSLTEILRQLHHAITPTQYGTGTHKVAVMNLGRVAEQMRRFCWKHASGALSAPSRFRWSQRAAAECSVAFDVARNYSMFCIDFPAWHANLYTAELVDGTTIRFRSGDSQLARRVNAYGKGIRPLGSAIAPEGTVLPALTQQLQTSFAETLGFSRTRGLLGVDFRSTDALRVVLRDMYAARLSGLFRRYPNISLGAYTLEQFRNCYVALLALVGAHEHLCFLWARDHQFPLDSAVMVYTRSKLTQLLTTYSGESSLIVSAVLPDLIAGAAQAQDLQTLPIVPLARDGTLLAVAPAFPLASNWEDNILRVCSYLRSKIHSLTSLTKEEEMSDDLKASVRAPRKVTGPVNLAKGVPDLDLLLEDPAEDAVVLAELKWPRKPYSPREIIERDSEIRKGIAQIKAIKSFLAANPSLLVNRGKLSKPLNDYRHVQFCVISRDHLIASHESDFPVFGFDAFVEQVSGLKPTSEALLSLNSMDWLPREGTEFSCEWIRGEAGGVTTLTELFRLNTENQPVVPHR